MPNSSAGLIDDKEELLRYLKSRTPAYHLSNLFFRDFQYAILSYAQSKGRRMSYGEAEELAASYIASLQEAGILKPIKQGSWMLNYPAFKTVSEKRTSPQKPAAATV